jgi:hypothetical protein
VIRQVRALRQIQVRALHVETGNASKINGTGLPLSAVKSMLEMTLPAIEARIGLRP